MVGARSSFDGHCGFRGASVFRSKAVLFGIAVVLAWATASLQSDHPGFHSPQTAAPNHSPENPATTAAGGDLAALVESAAAPALLDEDFQDWQVDPRPITRRLAPPVSSTGSRAHRTPCYHRVPPANWVPSYLPQSEFCTVLSRFRL